MSATPEFEMSSQYTYISAAMAEGLEEIMKQDYAINADRIPRGVLVEAGNLFEKALRVVNEEITSTEDVTAWLMVLDHLRALNPAKYPPQDMERKVLYQDVRNLASLIENFGLPKIPKDQREYVPILQKFFALLTETGENAVYTHHMSGKWGKYVYS